MPAIKLPPTFQKSTLGRSDDGPPEEFFAKNVGYGTNDMTFLPELTKEAILFNLELRFQGEVVYTYVGDIVVSVNPFKNVGCVGKAIRAKYHKGNRQAQPPHIYALVDSTFDQMRTEQHSQSILISGESGAGKTEAMKICLTYIGELSKMNAKKGKGGGAPAPPPSRPPHRAVPTWCPPPPCPPPPCPPLPLPVPLPRRRPQAGAAAAARATWRRS